MTVTTARELVDAGLALHRRGAVAEAAERYGEALRADPGNADAHYYLGLLSCQSGRFAEGAEHARNALKADARHVQAHILLGRALAALGRRAEALSSFERAIALEPGLARAHSNRADMLNDLGRYGDAIAGYDQAVALQPDSVEDWFNRGLALMAAGRPTDAVASFERAIACDGEFVNAHLCRAKILLDLGRYDEALAGVDAALAVDAGLIEAWVGRGNILAQLKRYEEALAACDRGLALKPDLADVWFDRGNVLHELHRHDDATASYKQATVLNPNLTAAWCALGDSYSLGAQADAAFAAYEKALGLKPGFAEAWLGCGNVLYARRQFDESSAAYERALALKSDLAEAWLGRGNICLERKQLDGALAAYDKGLALKPELAGAWYGRGAALLDMGRAADAIGSLDRALAIRPDYPEAGSLRIFATDFEPEYGFAEQQNARKIWWQTIGSRVARRSPVSFTNTRDPDRRIKIGYVSADFRNHSAAHAFKPILLNHDKSQFDITCYSGTVVQDAVTGTFKQAADRWRDVAQDSDDALAQKIGSDGIDILVDLSGHSAGNRLTMFARKPAPVQVSAWGHAAGTGLPTVDYLFSDPVSCPSAIRHLFAEQIFDLPCLITVDALTGIIPASELPALSKGYITFGVFNRASKISDEAVALWSRILRTVPNTRILLKHGGFDLESTRKSLLEKFVAQGIGADRVEFRGQTSRRDHLAAFGDVDISLDPFPMAGGISTWESLQMGVPLVAKLGDSLASRVGGAIVSSIGLGEWVAETTDGYADIAVKFASMPDRLAQLRRDLPSMITASAAGNPVTYTRAVEAAYRTMWTDYCAAAS